jgi:hypothetical protein
MNKRICVLCFAIFVFLAVGSVFASDVCVVLDASGNKTTDTINVSVSSSDNKTGVVKVVVSSDSDKPVNAYLTITVDGKTKLSDQSIRIEPFQSGVKEFNVGSWTFPNGKSSSTVKVDISGAKCLK